MSATYNPRLSRPKEGHLSTGFGYSGESNGLGPPGMGKAYDSTPHLPPAGLGQDTSTLLGDPLSGSVDAALKPEIFDPPKPCPDHIKKWRKDHEPGARVIHPGTVEDVDFKKLSVYGRPEPVGVKVHEIMNVQPKSYLLEKAIEKSEGIYLSNQREPLGKAWVRGHSIPQHNVESGFGKPTPQDISGDASKMLLHPAEVVADPGEHALYVKSHSNYNPGEQRRRGYSWVDKDGGIDPGTYSFGGMGSRDPPGMVARLINPPYEERSEAVVVEKRLEDYREISKDPLGRVKPVGHGMETPGDFVFGAPSQTGPEWGVKECIGNYTKEDQQPDENLGKSIRPGWRNCAPPEREFGVPSIRTDVPAPALKSVADHQNYGNETGCGELLYPPRHRDAGVDGDDFLEARSEGEIAAIFAAAGAELPPEQIAEIYAKAAELDSKGFVSVESFRRVLNGF